MAQTGKKGAENILKEIMAENMSMQSVWSMRAPASRMD
jgi:hypothetical protein